MSSDDLIPASARIACAADVLVERFDGETVIHHRLRNVTMLLNATADAVWHLCQQPLLVDELIDELAEAYQQPRDAIAPDVYALLRGWRDQGLITITHDHA
ncbi:PqqD family protein [Gammaproteobacteria bacterium]|nr:PqqD family protein [Gammaproteobacteria bacterium]